MELLLDGFYHHLSLKIFIFFIFLGEMGHPATEMTSNKVADYVYSRFQTPVNAPVSGKPDNVQFHALTVNLSFSIFQARGLPSKSKHW